MRYEEIKGCESNFGSLSVFKSGRHYEGAMSLGRFFPTTAAQAKRFIKDGRLDVLYKKDAAMIDEIMRKHGFEGDYCYTKSKQWVRLQNLSQFKAALAKEYGIHYLTKVQLSGGFHNCPEICIFVPTDKWESVYSFYNGVDKPVFFNEILTDSQRKRLHRHFCGMSTCCCDSYWRADIAKVD